MITVSIRGPIPVGEFLFVTIETDDGTYTIAFTNEDREANVELDTEDEEA